ncbi:RagB/SusD family nutrient uptake outer membrane protein [Leeuwenhoekiella sp. A16]|uniref:RagB/SusD family nutrient uptake outer membrane protein n=1 Tax=unclassified Leeuwenhoekiella TaxID=2615029 RepID=UPI003A7FC0BA|tara:strand:+ start:49073 stop:50437 length:1365 start_codon:yes stop_codon:yes gene_type:complete
MKNINILFYVIFISLTAVSCDNDLEIEPQQDIDGSLALANEQNLDALRLGIYDESGQSASYGGYLQITNDLLGTDDQVTWDGTYIQPRQYIQKSVLIDNSFVGDTWANAYESINQANLIVDNLDVIESGEDTRDRIEGEAKFLRALNYFDLVRLWALPYEGGETNSQPGVPLRLIGYEDYSQPLPASRATVEEIYTQVLSDLDDAYNMLPEYNDVFADKYAAQALRARVYLQMDRFADARDAANDVIKNSDNELTNSFAQAFNNDADSSEDVFDFQVTNQTGSNSLNTFYASQDNGGRGGDIAINPEYMALFDDPANDQRASFFVIGDRGSDLTAKYTNQFANIPIIRLAEMYLIRAEGNLRLGTLVGNAPLADVNMIRMRSNASPLLGSLTVDDILLERQLELAFEGFLLQDIKRTQGMVGSLNYDDPSLVLPIPQNEMDTNTDIAQNPGYGS